MRKVLTLVVLNAYSGETKKLLWRSSQYGSTFIVARIDLSFFQCCHIVVVMVIIITVVTKKKMELKVLDVKRQRN